MRRVFVGLCHTTERLVFRSEKLPTQGSHGHLYGAVVGPFRTVRAAEFMAAHGQSNPHCRCVADAERLSRK